MAAGRAVALPVDEIQPNVLGGPLGAVRNRLGDGQPFRSGLVDEEVCDQIGVARPDRAAAPQVLEALFDEGIRRLGRAVVIAPQVGDEHFARAAVRGDALSEAGGEVCREEAAVRRACAVQDDVGAVDRGERIRIGPRRDRPRLEPRLDAARIVGQRAQRERRFEQEQPPDRRRRLWTDDRRLVRKHLAVDLQGRQVERDAVGRIEQATTHSGNIGAAGHHLVEAAVLLEEAAREQEVSDRTVCEIEPLAVGGTLTHKGGEPSRMRRMLPQHARLQLSDERAHGLGEAGDLVLAEGAQQAHAGFEAAGVRQPQLEQRRQRGGRGTAPIQRRREILADVRRPEQARHERAERTRRRAVVVRVDDHGDGDVRLGEQRLEDGPRASSAAEDDDAERRLVDHEERGDAPSRAASSGVLMPITSRGRAQRTATTRSVRASHGTTGRKFISPVRAPRSAPSLRARTRASNSVLASATKQPQSARPVRGITSPSRACRTARIRPLGSVS
jgi:hypothetical protein